MNRRRVLLASVCASAAPFLVARGPSAKEQKVTSKLVESIRPFAFSRYLIDLPSGLAITDECRVTLTYGLGSDFVTTEVEVLDPHANESKLKAVVRSRSAKIAGEQNEELKISMLASNITISETAVMLRRFKSYLLTESFIIELYALVGDALVVAKASVYKNNIAPVEARLTKLLSQMSRPADPARAGKGFVLGPVLIDAGQDQEHSSITLHDAARPDVWFAISTNAIGADPDKSLLQRGDANDAKVRSLGAKWDTLRRGKIRIANMDAEEELIGYKAEGKTGFLFAAESQRTQPSFERQRLKFDLTSGSLIGGAPAESSLSKSEMIAVWDVAIQSVRLRPAAV